MQIFLRIFKEIGISVIILGLLGVAIVLLFKDQFFFLRSSVPNPIVYNGIDQNKFSVDGSIEDLKDPAKIYQSTNSELRTYEDEHRVKTGLSNPFNATGISSSNADVPNEKVTIRNNATLSYSGDFINIEAYQRELEEQARLEELERARLTEEANKPATQSGDAASTSSTSSTSTTSSTPTVVTESGNTIEVIENKTPE